MSFFIIHPREIEEKIKEKNALIVDLRERSAYQKYHYRNAFHMPYQESEIWLEKFSRGRCYILYCDYGNISLLTARKLSKKGIEVYTVVGGAKGMYHYFYGKEL